MNFDDLQFSGLTIQQSPTSNTGFCILCNNIVTVEAGTCLSCGIPCAVGTQPPTNWSTQPNNNINANTRTIQYNQLLHNTNNVVQFDSNMITQFLSNNNDIDIEQLLSTLMTHDTSYNTKSISKLYIDSLHTIQLTKRNFIKIVIDCKPSYRRILPTQAEFGINLINLHNVNSTDNVQVHYTNKLILSNDIYGNNIINSDQLDQSIVMMQRGIIPFSSKAHNTQLYNAAALIIMQDNKSKFPFTITDTTNSSHHINIPVLMISYHDGSNILQSLQQSSLIVSIQTEISELCCAVCLNEFHVNDDAIELPCHHYFDESCIKPWLQKHSSSCPVCRFQLPTDDGGAERRKKQADDRKYNTEQLNNTMFN